MGIEYHYICDNCSLDAYVAGGESGIRMGSTQTFYCQNCSSLFDAITHSHGLEGLEPESVKCYNCRSKRLDKWNDGEPCPKCKGNLHTDRDGMGIRLVD